jgi:threonine/homoserine/homoserine lactone efflux protein
VTDALLAGVLAGLAVAMPLGAIGVLIVELGATAGFRTAWAAGLGTATADLVYGCAAAFAGAALAGAIEGARSPIALVGAGVLAVIAVRGLLRTRHSDPGERAQRPHGRTYLAFLGLTAINPLTIAIFAAIVAGLPEIAQGGGTDKAAFVIGVGGASTAWQSTLAAGGALLGRADERARRWTSVAGHLIVLALAVRLAAGAWT